MEPQEQSESPDGLTPRPRTTQKRGRAWLVIGAATVGAAIGGAGIANAATNSTASTSAASTSTSPVSGSSTSGAANPATLSHGPGETLLTGTTAAKVKAAALAADPGATIIRVETDSGGSPYEAHITKADGTQATLKVDANFNVTATQSGFGSGPGGQAPPTGGAPAA